MVPQPGPGVQPFDVVGILRRGVSIALANAVPFGALALIVTSPMFLYGLLVFSGGPSGSMLTPVLASILQWLLNSAAIAALVFGTIRAMRNYTTNLKELMNRGVALVFPVIWVIVVVSFAIGIGMLLFIVPGLILYTMFWVAIPVAVIERRNVIDSLKRSIELTRGNRWRIFGLIVLLVVTYLGAGFVLNSVFGVGAAPGGESGATVFGLIVSWILQAVFAVLFAVVIAISYHDLRLAREGGSLDEIAAVFE